MDALATFITFANQTAFDDDLAMPSSVSAASAPSPLWYKVPQVCPTLDLAIVDRFDSVQYDENAAVALDYLKQRHS